MLCRQLSQNNGLTLGAAVMDDTLCRHFFSAPAITYQRQYEALRAVFLDGCPQQEIAQRFGYSAGAFRHLVGQFRATCAAGTPPPFLPSPVGDGCPPLARTARIGGPLVQTSR
jgi:hypothetical protein